MDTLEIMGDAELMAAFRQGVKDMEEGRIKPLDDVLIKLMAPRNFNARG